MVAGVVLTASAAIAGAARTEIASNAAEMVFNMVVLLGGPEIARCRSGWPVSPINAGDLKEAALNPI